MNRKKVGIILFCILALWTAIIFYFSSQPPSISHGQSTRVVRLIRRVNEVFDITPTAFYQKAESFVKDVLLMGRYKSTNAVVRKSAHFGIYFVLGMICSSFGYVYSKKILIGFLLGISLPVTVAVLDEFNQSFVGRSSSLNDVLIDGTGAFAGTVVIMLMIVIGKGIKGLGYKKIISRPNKR